jgi:N-acetylglucosamine kinase-like BadF-type ATPase
LTDRFLDALGHGDVAALFEEISRGRSVGLRMLAPIVTRLADEGDEVASGIVVEVAGQHADLAVAVSERVALGDDPFDLVTAGAVHASGGCFADAFAQRVTARCPMAMIRPLDVPPVLGGIRLALDTLGPPEPEPSTSSPFA